MYRGVIQKAYNAKASPRSAIKAMCLSCVGYLRLEVTNCTAFGCPLHGYRPYQQNDDQEATETTEIAAEAREV